MPTRPAASAGLLVALVLAAARGAAQVSFEEATRDLSSPDAGVRLRAVQMLKNAAYPEAAVPIARLLTDANDGVKFEAIAAELNIFLAQKVVSRRRVALVIEVRNRIDAESAFSAGPSVLGPRLVPLEVLQALRQAARDKNPRVGIEALYAFGTLGVTPGGNARRQLLRTSGPDLAAMLGSADPTFRFAAIRVIERVFAKRPQDEPIDTTVGDAVITLLNAKDRTIRVAAIDALGSMRYERSTQSLADLFQYYGKGDLAEALLDALARIAHPSSAALFSSALSNSQAPIRRLAIEGLTRIGDRRALPAIQTALTSERDESVMLAGTFSAAVLGEGSLDQLAESLGRARARERALQYLIEMAPGRTAALARYAQDPDARRRADAADILGLGGDSSALAIVQPLMKDSDPEVVLAAQRAVARLRAM